jgi:MYXO-CTERM domain-containing protein
MRKASLLILSVAASSILLGIAAVPAAAGVVNFHDSNFNRSDWTNAVLYQSGNGGRVGSIEQQAPDRLDGSYRQIEQTVNANKAGAFSCFWEFYQYGNGITTGVFNPVTQGPIESIDYSQWAQNTILGTPAGFAMGAAIKQNGRIYITLLDTNPEKIWTMKSHAELTANDFRLITNANAHPDFSATAATIFVGFYIGNSGTRKSGAFTVGGGLDDWNMTINTPVGAPEPAAMTLLALGGLALLRRRSCRRASR